MNGMYARVCERKVASDLPITEEMISHTYLKLAPLHSIIERYLLGLPTTLCLHKGHE